MKQYKIELIFLIVWAILMAIALSACSKPAEPRCQHLIFVSKNRFGQYTQDLGMVCGRDLDSCRAHWVTVVEVCGVGADTMYYQVKK